MGKITVSSYRRIVPPYGHYAQSLLMIGKEVSLKQRFKLSLR